MQHSAGAPEWGDSRKKTLLEAARASVRDDAKLLRERLETMLAEGGGHERADEAWHTTFLGLIGLVYVSSHERGELLDAVRCYLEAQLKDARVKIKQLNQALLKLQKDANVLKGEGGGDELGRRASAARKDEGKKQQVRLRLRPVTAQGQLRAGGGPA